MGRVISCRMLTKGADSSTREEMFLPQPVITELNCLKSSPALGRQIGMCTLKEQMAIVRVRRAIQGWSYLISIDWAVLSRAMSTLSWPTILVTEKSLESQAFLRLGGTLHYSLLYISLIITEQVMVPHWDGDVLGWQKSLPCLRVLHHAVESGHHPPGVEDWATTHSEQIAYSMTLCHLWYLCCEVHLCSWKGKSSRGIHWHWHPVLPRSCYHLSEHRISYKLKTNKLESGSQIKPRIHQN